MKKLATHLRRFADRIDPPQSIEYTEGRVTVQTPLPSEFGSPFHYGRSATSAVKGRITFS